MRRLQETYRHLRGVELEEIGAQPLILIGADYAALQEHLERRVGDPDATWAVRTLLGWSLYAEREIDYTDTTTQCMMTLESDFNSALLHDVQRLWLLDVIPYQSEKQVTRSKDDKKALDMLDKRTIRVEVNGVHRYATPLLWDSGQTIPQAPKEAVVHLLTSIKNRLRKDPDGAASYSKEMRRLRDEGYIVPVPQSQTKIQMK